LEIQVRTQQGNEYRKESTGMQYWNTEEEQELEQEQEQELEQEQAWELELYFTQRY